MGDDYCFYLITAGKAYLALCRFCGTSFDTDVTSVVKESFGGVRLEYDAISSTKTSMYDVFLVGDISRYTKESDRTKAHIQVELIFIAHKCLITRRVQ